VHTDDDITPAILQAYEVVEAPATPTPEACIHDLDSTASRSTGSKH